MGGLSRPVVVTSVTEPARIWTFILISTTSIVGCKYSFFVISYNNNYTQESGYHSYSTFSAAFKQRMHKSVAAWMREEVLT